MKNYLNKFNKPELYQEIYEYAKEYQVPIILNDSLALIKMLIKQASYQKEKYHILEIGCAIGYSSLHFISVAENVFVDTIERNAEMINLATSNFSHYDTKSRITLYEGDALEIELPSDSRYDMIFIDAAKAQNIKFFNKFSPYLKDDGMIITDNLYFHGCMEKPEEQTKNVRNMVMKIDNYNHFLASHPIFLTTFVPIGDGISISIKEKKCETGSRN